MVSANLTCFGVRLLVGFSASICARISRLLSGVRSSWLMLARNSLLYLEVSDKLLGLLFQRLLGLLDFAVLGFDFGLLLGQQLRLFLQLGVGLLQLLGQRLALLQQLLGPHGGRDGVQHDADALRELIEERQVDVAELLERGQLDHRLDFAFEQHRQHHDAQRRARCPGWS